MFSSKSKNWRLIFWNYGKNFCDQPVNDSIKQYDEIRKESTGQGHDYTTGCLLDCKHIKES